MNALKVDSININNLTVIKSLDRKLKKIITKKRCYYKLYSKDNGTFALKKEITTEAGWYVILNGKIPVYVGISTDLNNRLNDNNGSRDSFSDTTRISDSKRNFIKRFSKIGFIPNLNVCFIKESDLGYSQLSKLDRENIEKYIDISRGELEFKKNIKGSIK